MAFANVDVHIVQRSDAHTHAPTNIHSIMLLVAEEIKIVAGRLFDPEKLEFIVDQVITVSEKTGLIHDLKPLSDEPQLDFSSPNVIDLRKQTVLPGFVDTHVHCTFPADLFSAR